MKVSINIKLAISSILTILILSSCDSTEPTKHNLAYIQQSVLADGFGNSDGTTQDEEITSLIEYFNSNIEAWFIGPIAIDYRDTTINKIPANNLIEMSKNCKQIVPFSSEEHFINEFINVQIQTPWIGIYIVKRGNDKYYISKFYRAPGPKVGEKKYWKELTIIFN